MTPPRLPWSRSKSGSARHLGCILACIALGACVSQSPARSEPNIVVDGLAYRLVSESSTYWVGEPYRMALHVENVSAQKRTLPLGLGAAYDLLRRGPDFPVHEQGGRLVEAEKERGALLPGASRVIALPRTLEARCFVAGTHHLRYRYFGSRAAAAPAWTTPEVMMECMPQDLVIPEGSDPQVISALHELHASPHHSLASARPGWTLLAYSIPMQEIASRGAAAAPALLANLHLFALELPIVQLLGDLGVKEAVPQLLERLWMEDDPHDSLIIANLAEITGHPDGYGFHRRWFDEATRLAAVRTYREWWADYQRKRRVHEPEE